MQLPKEIDTAEWLKAQWDAIPEKEKKRLRELWWEIMGETVTEQLATIANSAQVQSFEQIR